MSLLSTGRYHCLDFETSNELKVDIVEELRFVSANESEATNEGCQRETSAIFVKGLRSVECTRARQSCQLERKDLHHCDQVCCLHS